MAGVQRKASIVWTGDVKRGGGTLSMDSIRAGGELPVSLPTRAGEAQGNTNPEELIAAAHVGCYAMALSNVLTQQGNPPERLEASAACTLEQAGAGVAVTRSDLTVRGEVPDLDENGFQEAARTAERRARSRTRCAGT